MGNIVRHCLPINGGEPCQPSSGTLDRHDAVWTAMSAKEREMYILKNGGVEDDPRSSQHKVWARHSNTLLPSHNTHQGESLCVVVDTNTLLQNIDLVIQLKDIWQGCIGIPTTVLHELDGLKKDNERAYKARSAINIVNEMIENEDPNVILQNDHARVQRIVKVTTTSPVALNLHILTNF